MAVGLEVRHQGQGDINVDDIINQLLVGFQWHQTIESLSSMMELLCPVARRILMKEPSLLELKAPIKIPGDFHGQLRSIFKYGGLPPQSNYLFMGNYIGPLGNWSLRIVLLLALKVRYPDNIYLLKGNLDDDMCNTSYTSDHTTQILYDCLKYLPIAALINGKIICTHGGLSPDLHDLDQIRHIKRPINLPYPPLLLDLLGHSTIDHPRGDDIVAKEVDFLEKNDLRLIWNGHQVVPNCKDFSEHRVISISSVSDRPEYQNTMMMSMELVEMDLKCSFHSLRHKREVWSHHIFMGATMQHTFSSKSVNLATIAEGTSSTSSHNSRSRTSAAKLESSQRDDPSSSNLTTKHRRSGFPGTKLVDVASEPNHGISVGVTSKLVIDPASRYRSTSPGVKRFLGARV